MDLAKIHNPYDFANPVSDRSLFVGRKKELEEIKYYLDHTKTAPRPINLAILGPRASGKTSLLNISELEAKDRGFCTVRINLDEGDAKTELNFFCKLFDGIFSSACELGAFGGVSGKTYDIYLDALNTYQVPDDKAFCPFLFPLQYAKAMSSGNINAQVMDHNFRNDLAKISSEVRCPIIILFDECNVLAKSRVHLEKLRNTFMNIPGFMLVITGTPDLFPLIDDVFSPIIRQFKKINVGGFKEESETEACIRKPLEKIGIRPEDVFDTETLEDVSEIHDLCGGRPYEIQLICHMLFRRLQSKRAQTMRLDLGVLEEVRTELETSQDMASRPILQVVRGMTKRQLSALGVLCRCDGIASLEQIWAIEYIARGKTHWTKSALQKALRHLINTGVVGLKKDTIVFSGDDFDKIYIKYFAREHRAVADISDLPLELFWHIRLNQLLQKIGQLNSLPGVFISDSEYDLLGLVKKLSSESSDADVFVEVPLLARDVYHLMIDCQDSEYVTLFSVKLAFPWLQVQSWQYATQPCDAAFGDLFAAEMKPLKDRTKEVGGELCVDTIQLPVANVQILSKKVETTANEMMRKTIAREHTAKMAIEYIERSDLNAAIFHADLALRYNPTPNPLDSNNLGYVYFAAGNREKAKYLLERAIEQFTEPSDKALPSYNLGILDIKSGDFQSAIARIDSSVKFAETLNEASRECACLFVPRLVKRRLEVQEKRTVNLLETAQKAKEVVEKLVAS